MANNVIGSLIVNLGLETARLNSDTKKASRHFNSFEKRASRSLNKIKFAARGLVGALAGVGLTALGKSSIDAADKIGKLSTRLGASTEALSQYQHVAELSGISFETLSMGWQRMTRRVAEAAQGTGEAKNALIELNLSAQDLNNLRPEQQFEVLADALNSVENQADKVRLAMKLFDSEGVSLLQTMEGGSDGIRRMRQEADSLNLTLSKDQTAAAAAANDAMSRLQASVTGLQQTMAISLGPELSNIANWLTVNLPLAVRTSGAFFDEFRIGALGIYADIASALAPTGEDNPIIKSVRLTIDRLIEEYEDAKRKIQGFKKEYEPAGKNGSVGGQAQDGDEELWMWKEAQRKANEEAELSSAERLLQINTDLNNAKIREDEKLYRYKRFLNAKDTYDTLKGLQIMTAGATKESRKMFELNKAASIAVATMNSHEAYTKALAQGGIWGAVKAAAILATGLAQVQSIASTSFGGGSSASSSTPISGGLDEPTQAQTQQSSPESGQQLTIYIKSDGNDKFTDAVMDSIEVLDDTDRLTIIKA